MRLAFLVILSSLWMLSGHTLAAPVNPVLVQDKKLASIQVHTVDELNNLLDKIDRQRATQVDQASPVLFVLHGEEARTFIRGNYSANQSVVDKTAKLAALGHVQIEVCETWMGFNNIQASELQPFVKTVRFAPARISDLLENQNYTYF